MISISGGIDPLNGGMGRIDPLNIGITEEMDKICLK